MSIRDCPHGINKKQNLKFLQTARKRYGTDFPAVCFYPDPDSKTVYWGTPKGKDMKLDPQSVTFTAKEGAVFLQLNQDSGIEVHSNHPLTLKANDNITFAGKTISISATESMRLTCGSSSIVLDGIGK
ncbi:hypothetical protein ACOMCU_27515 [Lysinibacillus sp. UGB7]|uniref:hypothetical protein n=1 Tax=Lysinibacillus sp. UGB7 TaxID=3411039 RepID=UPI003B7CE98B